MKRALTALIMALSLALSLSAQTTAPSKGTWFKVGSEGNYFAITSTGPSITLRVGTGVGTTSTGTDCNQPEGCWNVFTPTIPLAQVYLDCCFGGIADPAPGLVKEIDIAETGLIQSVLVNGTPVIVPALPPPPPPPGWPPVTFTVGSLYYMVVQNIPPATATSPLQALLSIKNGEVLLATFVCNYNTTITLPTPPTISGTPPELSALFGCIPLQSPFAKGISQSFLTPVP